MALYVIPWQHIPVISIATEDLSHEMRLALSAIAGIIVVFVCSFVYHIAATPKEMYFELSKRLDRSEAELSEIHNVERDRAILSDLHKKGVALYGSFVSKEDPDAANRWKRDLDNWLNEVRDHLKENWSVTTIHEFNDPSRKGGFSYQRQKDGLEGQTDAHGFSITALYSGYIASLDHIIRYNSGDHFGQRPLFGRLLIKGEGSEA